MGASSAVGREANQTVRHWDAALVPDPAGRTERPEPQCPVEVALAAVAGKWTTLVLRELMHGALSYSELGKRLPRLSEKVLSERLATLREQGIVVREVDAGFPVRTTYRLSERGQALRPLLVELYRTGQALRQLEPH